MPLILHPKRMHDCECTECDCLDVVYPGEFEEGRDKLCPSCENGDHEFSETEDGLNELETKLLSEVG